MNETLPKRRAGRPPSGAVNEVDLALAVVSASAPVRAAVAAREQDGLSIAEIAELAGCHPLVVRQTLASALRKLRLRLDAEVRAGRLCPEDFAARDAGTIMEHAGQRHRGPPCLTD